MTRYVERGEPSRAAATVPLVAEKLHVGKRRVETGRVRVRKVVQEEMRTVAEPLKREQVTVERRKVERVVSGPQPTRREGDALIIPIVEEELVIQKRLVVREELVVRTRVIEERRPQRIAVLREEARVERQGPQDRWEPIGNSDEAATPPGATAGNPGRMDKRGTKVARPARRQGRRRK